MLISSLRYMPIYFNSIKVRLELRDFMIAMMVLLFQFHKGTIRTYRWRIPMIIYLLFQFHKGTIRTLKRIRKHILKY